MTYHVDVGEIPFMVALDYTQKAIVISIRGTLSLEVSNLISASAKKSFERSNTISLSIKVKTYIQFE